MPDQEKKQRHDAQKNKMPTDDGVYEDERGPAPGSAEEQAAVRASGVQIAFDLHSRVINFSIEDEQTVITIAAGAKQGVFQDMHGVTADGQEFQVMEVGDRFCRATVHATLDELSANPSVILNPTVKPAPVVKKNQHARIIDLQIHGEQARITIARGKLQGIMGGEKGVVVSADGRKIADFVVQDVGGRVCFAMVPLTEDQLQGADVILNPG